MSIFSLRSSKSSKRNSSATSSLDGIEFAASPSPTSDLSEQHGVMENKINELRDLNQRRDSDMKIIKETIQECRGKIRSLRSSMGVEDLDYPTIMEELWDFVKEWNWSDKGNWNVIGGTVLLLYLLNFNLCYRFLPPLPTIYGFFFLFTITNHFLLVAGAHPIRSIIKLLGITETMLQEVESSMQPSLHATGAGACVVALTFLKLKQCCTKSCVAICLQMVLTISAFFAELFAYSYDDSNVRNRNRNLKEKFVAFVQIINIFMYLMIN